MWGCLHHWTFINVARKWKLKIKYNISISEICGLHCLTWPTWNAFQANHSFTICHGKKRSFCHDKTHQWGYLASWTPRLNRGGYKRGLRLCERGAVWKHSLCLEQRCPSTWWSIAWGLFDELQGKDCRWQADECYWQWGRNVHELAVDNDGKRKLLLRMA